MIKESDVGFSIFDVIRSGLGDVEGYVECSSGASYRCAKCKHICVRVRV